MKNFFKSTYLFLIISIFLIVVFSFFVKNIEASNIGTIPDSSLCTEGTSCAELMQDNSKINFGCTNCEVQVEDTFLSGYAWGSNIGWINLKPTQYGGVINNTGGDDGVLSGYAWGQNAGWINFKPTYSGVEGVTIDTNNGEFNGYAWSQNYGWIHFDCSIAGKSANKCVTTTWRPSHTTTGGSGGGGENCSNGATNYPTCTFNCTNGATNYPTCTITEIEDETCEETGNCPQEVTCDSLGTCITAPVTIIENIINSINTPLINFLNQTFSPPEIEKIKTGLKVTTATSAIIATGITIGTALLLSPLATPEILLLPLRLWALLLTGLGLRKKIKPWGTVYDSVTKQPLDPVYVTLFNLDGAEVSSSITDLDGRYGFLVPPGVYKVVPGKTNYIFPSAKLASHISDELYPDLYFGDYLHIAEGETIAKNIPMDAINFDWNEFAKNKKQIFNFYSKKEVMFARISSFFFVAGAILAVLALFIAPEPYNLIIFGLYVLLFILRRVTFKKKARGKLIDKNGDPLSFALIRVFGANTNVEIAHKVADKMGRYFCLIPNGQYYVQVENKNPDESYSVVYKSETLEIKNGILNKVFNV